MSPHQTIAVAVRLFAIWLAIYAGRMVPAFYREVSGTDDTGASVAIIVIAVFVLLFVLLLWFFPRTVARGLLDAKSLVPVEPASADTWFAVGCALIGLWLLIPALASVIYNLSVIYLAQRDSAIDMTSLRFPWTYYLVEIAFGVWLLLGARGIRRLFWWARNAR
jgi:hypothetical protein